MKKRVREAHAAVGRAQAGGAKRAKLAEPRMLSMVGSRVRIKWGPNNAWYFGRIMRYNAAECTHLIHYDDSESQWTLMEQEDFMVGAEIVWAKLKGFPWWPAQVFRDLGSNPRQIEDVFVVFFGDSSCSWVKKNHVKPLDEHLAKHANNRVAPQVALAHSSTLLAVR